MKFIKLIALLFLPILSIAQTPPIQWLGQPNNIVEVRNAFNLPKDSAGVGNVRMLGDTMLQYFDGNVWVDAGSGGGNDSANIFTGTLSQSRALTSTPDLIVTTDYGGGTWFKDDTVTVDNTGTQIITAGGQGYSRVYDGALDVTWFGAIANDTLDDAPNFQSVVDALSGKGGLITITKGTYIFKTKVNIERSGNEHKIKIVGQGIGNTLIKMASGDNMNSTNTNCFFNLVGFNSVSTIDEIEIGRMSLQGDVVTDMSAGNVTRGVAIVGNGVRNSKFYELELFNLNSGMHLSNSTNIKIDKISSYNNKKVGIGIDGGENVDITNGNIYNNGRNGIWVTSAISTRGSNNVNILNNLSYNNSESGIAIQTDAKGVPLSQMNIKIKGNTSYLNGFHGIVTANICDGVSIEGNITYNNNNRVSGNVWGVDGIHIETNSKNVNISNNISYNSSGFGDNNTGQITGILVGEGSGIRTKVLSYDSTSQIMTVGNVGNWTLSNYFPPIRTFEEVGYSSSYGPALISSRSIFWGMTDIRNRNADSLTLIDSSWLVGSTQYLKLRNNIGVLDSVILNLEPRPSNITLTGNVSYNNRAAVRALIPGATHFDIFGVEIVPEVSAYNDSRVNIIVKPSVSGFVSNTNNYAVRNSESRGYSIPNDGYHNLGEIIYNIRTDTSNVFAWVCTAAGSPGTWNTVKLGNFIEAIDTLSYLSTKSNLRDSSVSVRNYTRLLDSLNIKQGGNSFGNNVVIGANDAFGIQFKVAGAVTGGINSTGGLYIGRISNSTTGNGAFYFNSSGILAERNVADANPSMTINQSNAASTGDILRLQKSGSTLSKFDINGRLSIAADAYSTGGNNLLVKNTTNGRVETIPTTTFYTKAQTDSAIAAKQVRDSVISITTSTSLTTAQYGTSGGLVIFADATTGSITITLPAAATTLGKTVWVKKIDNSVNSVTIQGAGGTELIDSATTHVMSTANQSIIIKSNTVKNLTF